MFHTPAHKVAPSLPQSGTIENLPYAGDPRVVVEPLIDVRVSNHGSIFLLQPVKDEGRDWLAQNLAHAQRFADAYAVEHRYVDDIIVGMIDDCLEVAA